MKNIINYFVDELFEKRLSLFIDNNDDIEYSIKESELQTILIDMKKDKNFYIKNQGKLGWSLYIRIKKNKKTQLLIRISYHKPLSIFLYDKNGNDNYIKNVLYVDVLSWIDEIKVHNLRLKKFQSELINGGKIKDKAYHKQMFYKHIKPQYLNAKFIDLETDDYLKIKDCIKTFIQENGFGILEMLNLNEYSIEYELINEEE